MSLFDPFFDPFLDPFFDPFFQILAIFVVLSLLILRDADSGVSKMSIFDQKFSPDP